MKLSKFNFLIKTKTGVNLFNTLNSSLVNLTKKEWKNIKMLDNEKNSLAIEDLNYLKENGFVIPNELDELKILEENYKRRQFDTKVFGLTIAPTLDCNFACPYCFEKKEKGIMSQTNQKKLLDFVESKLSAGNINMLDVLWFGGEPLLAWSVIESLSENLIRITKKYKVNYKAYIISNSFLFNDEIVAKLKNYQIEGVQVTLDGPESDHDKRRILQNGKPTFNKILTNIKKLIASSIKVDIRINIDKSNFNKLELLFDQLTKNGIENVSINFGHVLDYTENCKDISGFCLTIKDFASSITEYDSILKKYNFQRNKKAFLPPTSVIYCGAVAENSFTLDHNLNIYRCWNEIGNVSKATGSLLNVQTEQNKINNTKYITWNPFLSKKCTKCVFLPICMGGCPYLGMKTKNKICVASKYNLREKIDKFILENKK